MIVVLLPLEACYTQMFASPLVGTHVGLVLNKSQSKKKRKKVHSSKALFHRPNPQWENAGRTLCYFHSS